MNRCVKAWEGLRGGAHPSGAAGKEEGCKDNEQARESVGGVWLSRIAYQGLLIDPPPPSSHFPFTLQGARQYADGGSAAGRR